MSELAVRISEKIKNSIKCSFIDVANESHLHAVAPGSETHFKLVIVSKDFEKLSLIERHRKINYLLEDEFKNSSLHALALHTFSLDEWDEGASLKSPDCRGGSSGDRNKS